MNLQLFVLFYGSAPVPLTGAHCSTKFWTDSKYGYGVERFLKLKFNKISVDGKLNS